MKKIYLNLVLIFYSVSTFSQNTAYIHKDSAMRAIPTYNERLQTLATMQKNYLSEVKENRQALQKKLNALIGPYNPQDQESFDSIKKRMRSTDTLKLNLLLAEDLSIAGKEQTYNAIIEQEYQAKITPLLVSYDDALEQYAKKNKIDAIYALEKIGATMVYLNEAKIITKEIIDLVSKKEYPKKLQ